MTLSSSLRLFAAFAAAALLVASPAAGAKSLDVVSPTNGQIFYNGPVNGQGGPIIVKAKAKPFKQDKPPIKSVWWDISCTSCVPPGQTPTHASDFTDANFVTGDPQNDNITIVLGPGSYCATVKLYPDQPGWGWSKPACFTWSPDKGPKLVNIKVLHPVGITNPYPKNPDPGPVRPETAPENAAAH